MQQSFVLRLLPLMLVALLILPTVGDAAPRIEQGQNASNATEGVATTVDDPLPQRHPGNRRPVLQGEDDPSARDSWFYLFRTAGDPSAGFTLSNAASARAQAAEAVIAMKQQQGNSPSEFGGAWSPIGPDPLVQLDFSGDVFRAVSGRVSALAIRSSSPYTMYVGAAQGGVWISSTLTSSWIPKTDQLPSLAVGAIALAPSNEDTVYVGTGEGSLSGDSYYGNGILKSTDGGNTFTLVSGSHFNQVSISKIVVHPNDPNHLYAAVLSGVSGSRRMRPPSPTPYGIWESTDGGATWTARRTTTDASQAPTDLEIDPLQPNVLYASFLTQGIYRSTDAGVTWTSIMNGLPAGADYVSGLTRFALGLSRPAGTDSATLYVGFEWYDASGIYHPSTVWKSADGGANWTETNTAVVGGYCGESASFTQCWYDNVVAADPTDPNVVYALGLFDYNRARGGIYRSMDGGNTWTDLGYGLHPDYHAIAIRGDAPQNVVIGNDGGVWSSSSYGGRLSPIDPATAVTWVNLNGDVDRNTGSVSSPSGLQITQFTSIAQHPSITGRVYGGSQDNGTSRKAIGSNTWYDYAGGDGGQAIVDPANPNFIYGTYFDVNPYRFDDGMLGNLFSNQMILTGLATGDRSEFYIPMVMDPRYSNRLYLGSYRVYRTDNRGSQWQAISPDLTAGCTGTAPNGARGCVLTALGPTAGAPALYAGSADGRIHLSIAADQTSPVWNRIDKAPLPARPVTALAVDRSDYRVAYATYGGFSAATPSQAGHVFKTSDGGQTWTNISGNLPDVPVNTLVIEPSYPTTLYVGTDVGPMVTRNGGSTWAPLGSGFPIVTVWQLDMNPSTRLLRAATHGRGAWSLSDGIAAPALQIRKSAPSIGIGAGSLLTYTLSVDNIGNAPATGVIITDPVPTNTTFVSAGPGGSLVGNAVVWSGQTVANGSSTSVSFTVQVTTSAAITPGSAITNSDYLVTSAQGVGATGSPFAVMITPTYFPSLTPARQNDGTRSGQSITYTMSVQNMGSGVDSYDLSTTGNSWSTSFWNVADTTAITRISDLSAGAIQSFSVRVSIPSSVANGITDIATISAASTSSPTASSSVVISTTAVSHMVLLVDGDNSGAGSADPDVSSYYRTALAGARHNYNQWNLKANSTLPLNYMKAHRAIVWFTGATYPGPLLPYEANLAAFLDNGGRLFMSGMDVLDQTAGTTSFVRNYLHVDWDGTEAQNDIPTATVTAVPTNTVTGGMGTMALVTTTIGLANYMDQVTPRAPALPAFLDSAGVTNGLTVADGAYRVIFLAFPFEAMGTAGDRADLMARALRYFGLSQIRFPLVIRGSPLP